MNFRRIDEHELANLAANIAKLLAGDQLSAIDENVRADLIAALGKLPTQLEKETVGVAILDGRKMAAVSRRNAKRSKIETWVVQVRDHLKGGLAPGPQFTMCGLDRPAPAVGTYIARDPTNLTVTGFSNGTNKLCFRGNNRYGHVSYDLWRRVGKGGEWRFLRSTKRQKFVDTPVTPGQFYEYRVQAVAAKTVSNFSNPAVVYGVL